MLGGGNDNIHSSSTDAHGGSVEASFATSFAASIAVPKRATAWSLPDHLPMTGTSAQMLLESSPLSIVELREKRLKRFGSNNNSVGTKQKEPPSELSPALSWSNVVNLLGDSSDDEGDVQ